MDRNADDRLDRPLCPRCEQRRVYRGGYLCTGCSHKAVTRHHITRDDKQLEDTGLRLDVRNGILIQPDGSRTPAPVGLSLNYFFGRMSKGGIVALLKRRVRTA